MFLVVRKDDNMIVLSSLRPVSEQQYEEQGMYVVEIPDDTFAPDMVGGILYLDEASDNSTSS